MRGTSERKHDSDLCWPHRRVRRTGLAASPSLGFGHDTSCQKHMQDTSAATSIGNHHRHRCGEWKFSLIVHIQNRYGGKCGIRRIKEHNSWHRGHGVQKQIHWNIQYRRHANGNGDFQEGSMKRRFQRTWNWFKLRIHLLQRRHGSQVANCVKVRNRHNDQNDHGAVYGV